MTISEKILELLRRLPESSQQEVLALLENVLARSETTSPERTQPEGKPGGKRILVVEYQPRVHVVLKVRLERAGYEVFVAEDGLEGVKKARELRPDLITLGVMMPNLNGFQACAMLRRDDTFRHVPIMFLTAHGKPKDIEEGLRMGADAYMTKPYKLEELLDTVARLLAEAEKKKGELASGQ